MSSKNSAPRIRLAQAGSTGANLYNSYHLLTQISSVYAQGSELDHHAKAAQTWGSLCDSTLVDLGEIYSAWEQVLKDKPAAALDDQQLGAVIARACLRMDRALGMVNVWTPLAKWVTLARLGEARWQKVSAELARREPRIKPRLEKAQNESKSRIEGLKRLVEAASQIGKSMAQFDALERQLAAGEEG